MPFLMWPSIFSMRQPNGVMEGFLTSARLILVERQIIH